MMTDHSVASPDDHSHEGEHHSHGKTYAMVFGTLCIFTLMSIVADMLHLPNKILLTGIILAVATSKALCVMLYFMHLKFERAWKYLLLAPTFILAATIPFALIPDIGAHYYTVDVPQRYEYESQQQAKAAGHSSTDGHEAEKVEHH